MSEFGSVADLFATLGLDATQFNQDLQKAREDLASAAEDMARPIKDVNSLLDTLFGFGGPSLVQKTMESLGLAVDSVSGEMVKLNSITGEWAALSQKVTNQVISDLDRAVKAQIQLETDLVNFQASQATKRIADEQAVVNAKIAAEQRLAHELALIDSDISNAESAQNKARMAQAEQGANARILVEQNAAKQTQAILAETLAAQESAYTREIAYEKEFRELEIQTAKAASTQILSEVIATEKLKQQVQAETTALTAKLAAEATAAQTAAMAKITAEVVESEALKQRIQAETTASQEAAMAKITAKVIASEQLRQRVVAETAVQTEEMNTQESSGLDTLAKSFPPYLIARYALLAVIYETASAIKESIQSFIELDQAVAHSLANIQGLGSGLRDEVLQVSLDLATQFPVTATEIAKGFGVMATSGYDATAAIATMPAALTLATASGMTLAESINIVTAAQKGLGLQTTDTAQNLENYTRISNVLASANNLAGSTTLQYAQGLEAASSTLKKWGVSLEDGVALLAVFSQEGIRGSAAGNDLVQMFNRIGISLTANTEKWEALIGNVYQANGNFRPMLDIIEALKNKFDSLSPAQVRMIEQQLQIQTRSNKIDDALFGNVSTLSTYQDKIKSATDASVLATRATDNLGDSLTKNYSAWKELFSLFSGPAAQTFLKFVTAITPSSGTIGVIKGVTTLGSQFAQGTLPKAGDQTTTDLSSFISLQKEVADGYERIQAAQKAQTDQSNALTDKQVAQAKAAAAALQDMWQQEIQFHNSVISLFNAIPATYDEYVTKLDEGGKTAKSLLQSVETDIDKAETVMITLKGAPLSAMQAWVDKLTLARDTLKTFADTDAFAVAAQKISALSDKFPLQVTELSDLDEGFKQFFADMIAGAQQFPDSLGKIDIATITAKLLESQKQLDDSNTRLAESLNKAWEQYEIQANKAAGITSTLKQKIDDVTIKSTELADVLGGTPIGAAIAHMQALQADVKGLGLSFDDAESKSLAYFENLVSGAGSKALDAMDNQKQALQFVEAGWSRVSIALQRLALTDLPQAIKISQEYINQLVKLGATQGEIYAAQEAELALEIKVAALKGTNATKQIEDLQALKIKTLELNDATTLEGNTAVALFNDFTKGFDSIGKAIADNIVDQKSWTAVWHTTLATIEKDILNTLIGSAFKALEDAINKNTSLLTGLASTAAKAIGGLQKALGLSSSAGLTGTGYAAGATNVPLPPSLSSAGAVTGSGEAGVEGTGIASGVSEGANQGSGEAGGAAVASSSAGSAGSTLSTVTSIAGLGVAIASGVVNGIQNSRMINLLGEIEISTRQTKEQLTGGIQTSLNTYLPHLLDLTKIYWEMVNGNLAQIKDVLWWGVVNVNLASSGLGNGPLPGTNFTWAQGQQDAINAGLPGGTNNVGGAGPTPPPQPPPAGLALNSTVKSRNPLATGVIITQGNGGLSDNPQTPAISQVLNPFASADIAGVGAIARQLVIADPTGRFGGVGAPYQVSGNNNLSTPDQVAQTNQALTAALVDFAKGTISLAQYQNKTSAALRNFSNDITSAALAASDAYNALHPLAAGVPRDLEHFDQATIDFANSMDAASLAGEAAQSKVTQLSAQIAALQRAVFTNPSPTASTDAQSQINSLLAQNVGVPGNVQGFIGPGPSPAPIPTFTVSGATGQQLGLDGSQFSTDPGTNAANYISGLSPGDAIYRTGGGNDTANAGDNTIGGEALHAQSVVALLQWAQASGQDATPYLNAINSLPGSRAYALAQTFIGQASQARQAQSWAETKAKQAQEAAASQAQASINQANAAVLAAQLAAAENQTPKTGGFSGITPISLGGQSLYTSPGVFTGTSGASGISSLLNLGQPQQAQPNFGVNPGGGGTIIVQVPNPDGDVVAKNLIKFLTNRGVRLI